MASVKNPGPQLVWKKYGGESPIPEEFVAKMNRGETIQAEPKDVNPEALADTIVESRVETNRTDERVRHTILKDPGNVVLNQIDTNDFLQAVSVQRIMRPTMDSPSGTASALTNVASRDLGNGWSIDQVSTVGSIFDQAEVRKDQVEVIPQRFLAGIDSTVTSSIIAGTTATPTTLGNGVTGVISSSAQRATAFTIKKVDETRTVNVPITRTSYKYSSQFGGGQIVVTDKFDTYDNITSTLPDGALTTIEDEIVDIDGEFATRHTEVLSEEEWPTLYGTLVDEATGIAFNYEKKVVPAGTQGGSGANEYIEIQPVDNWRSISITTVVNLETLPPSVTYPVTADIRLPDSYTEATGTASSGTVYDEGKAYSRFAGGSGPAICLCTESYILESELATLTPGGVGRMISTGNTSASINTYNVTGDDAPYARVFTYSVPQDDVVVGDIVSFRVERLRFGVCRVIKITYS